MKNFGTVKSFDEAKGLGSITPEGGGKEIGFERSAISWEPKASLATGQRLSYDLSTTNGETSAVNLQNA